MRVSLPISTAACSPAGRSCSAASTLPAAYPRRITKSGVMGASPTRPRTPSVPKYFLLLFFIGLKKLHLRLPATQAGNRVLRPRRVRERSRLRAAPPVVRRPRSRAHAPSLRALQFYRIALCATAPQATETLLRTVGEVHV